MTVTVSINRLPTANDLPLPLYATEGSAGMDLYANVDVDTILPPGERMLVATGIAIALPIGYEAQVRPRSGLAAKSGISIVNSPGTIDSDYRGEIKVILINLGKDAFVIKRGDRVAQMVVAPVSRVVWKEEASLDTTVRAEGGFGSTGTK